MSAAVGEVTSLIPGPTCPNGSVGLISNVATRPHARGRGLASACTEASSRWFEDETDVTRIDLFATEAGALIYRTRGFTTSPFPAMRRSLPADPSAPAPFRPDPAPLRFAPEHLREPSIVRDGVGEGRAGMP